MNYENTIELRVSFLAKHYIDIFRILIHVEPIISCSIFCRVILLIKLTDILKSFMNNATRLEVQQCRKEY